MDGGRLGSSDRLSLESGGTLESKTSGNLREINKPKKILSSNLKFPALYHDTRVIAAGLETGRQFPRILRWEGEDLEKGNGYIFA